MAVNSVPCTQEEGGLTTNGRHNMAYVDGFVAAVPTTNREIYKKHAEAAAAVFKEHGALKFVECWGERCTGGESHLVSDGR